MAAEVGQTIAVFNKSGKVVSASKHLMGVFKEAKTAYRERKAEIIAERENKLQEQEARRALEAMTINDDTRSRHSERSYKTHQSRSRSHHPSHRRGSELTIRPPTERYHLGSSVRTTRGGTSSRRSASVSPRHSSRSIHNSARSVPSSAVAPDPSALVRRHTTQDMALGQLTRLPAKRSSSTSAIDMDLAYGEFHPKSLVAHDPESKDFKGLVSRAKVLLEEADCAHASVTAIIAHLQKNPEAMAAVALTLAEISNLATKMAPGALTALRASAPAVFALLASPQFLIAAGVGVGITVVMLGGFKIVKKLKAKNAMLVQEQEGSMDEMVELSSDVGRIENWRRGIVLDPAMENASANSTVVDGELITPRAAEMRSAVMPMPVPARSSSSMNDSRSQRSGSSSKGKSFSRLSSRKHKSGEKSKKPSPLRLMFK